MLIERNKCPSGWRYLSESAWSSKHPMTSINSGPKGCKMRPTHRCFSLSCGTIQTSYLCRVCFAKRQTQPTLIVVDNWLEVLCGRAPLWSINKLSRHYTKLMRLAQTLSPFFCSADLLINPNQTTGARKRKLCSRLIVVAIRWALIYFPLSICL